MSYKTSLPGRMAKREALKKQLDQFATFYWGETDMFEKYGAFILNDGKGSLQFVNGPQFTNQYGQTQWGESNYFIGVKFSNVKIDFTVGLYCFTIEEYQQFLHMFNPYRVDNLRFSFNPNWRYLVKPTQLPSSERYVLGNENGEPYYYTEIKMTFEIQGIPCARHIKSYELQLQENVSSPSQLVFHFYNPTTDDPDNKFVPTFLETPMNCSLSLTPVDGHSGQEYSVKLLVSGENDSTKHELFSITFPENLTNLSMNDGGTIFPLNLRYLSEEGVLLLSMANTEEDIYLLNLQTTIHGTRLIKSAIANKFVLPGKGNFPEVDLTKLRFVLELYGFNGFNASEGENSDKKPLVFSIMSFPRTNVI